MNLDIGQVTDIRGQAFFKPQNHENETINTYTTLPQIDIKALKKINEFHDSEVSKNAKTLLSNLHQNISILCLEGYNIELPNLNISFMTNENAIILEWIFKNFRVSFSIESNLFESSWHIISKKEFFDINASGDLPLDSSSLFKSIISFTHFLYSNDAIS